MKPIRMICPSPAVARLWTLLGALALVPALLTSPAHAQLDNSDKGKEVVGKLRATLYIGTDAEPDKLGDKLEAVGPAMTRRLSGIRQMQFRHYRRLGSDVQPVFRSYENWLAPLKPSEEILLSYELRGRSPDGGLRLDLEFWQHRRKVMKSDPVLHLDKPLLILGPKWRGGTLIIAVELTETMQPE